MKDKHKGFWATFNEEETKKLINAYNKMEKIFAETNHNNRDTGTLDEILKKLFKLVEQQYEQGDKK